MVHVSIDVEGCRGVASSLRTFYDDAMREWTSTANAAARALLSTSALKALSDPLVTIALSAKDLDARVDLAVLYNTGDDGRVPTGAVLSFDLPGEDTAANVRQLLGSKIADGLSDVYDGGAVRNKDVQRLDNLIGLMEKYTDDEGVMPAMFDRLGPEGTLKVPDMLRAFADEYGRSLSGLSDEDLFHGDDKEPMMSYLPKLQQRFLEALGNGLATASKAPGFDSKDFAQKLGDATSSPVTGASLSSFLRYGDYGDLFLSTLGGSLYEQEKRMGPPPWAERLDAGTQAWLPIGTEWKSKDADPMVSLFAQMADHPLAGLDFFSPANPTDAEKARTEYYLKDRSWRGDDFDAVADAVDRAATAFHTLGNQYNDRGAWLASAAVKHFGSRDDIGDDGKDSLAHLLSAYMADVDRTAWGAGDKTGIGVYPVLELDGKAATDPSGAMFDRDALRKLLSQVLTDKAAATQFVDSVSAYTAAGLRDGAEAWDGKDRGVPADTLRYAVDRGASLQGFVLGAMNAGLEKEGKDQDEKVKLILGLADDLVGLVPTGGTITSFLADQVKGQGSEWMENRWAGAEGEAEGQSKSALELTRNNMQIATTVALIEAGHLPVALNKDLPWVVDGRLDTSKLTQPEIRDRFLDFIGRPESGIVTELGPDIDAEVIRGNGSGHN